MSLVTVFAQHKTYIQNRSRNRRSDFSCAPLRVTTAARASQYNTLFWGAKNIVGTFIFTRTQIRFFPRACHGADSRLEGTTVIVAADVPATRVSCGCQRSCESHAFASHVRSARLLKVQTGDQLPTENISRRPTPSMLGDPSKLKIREVPSGGSDERPSRPQ